MSIQEHLNKIRNAIKGSEVRESIAKGIETAYDDASESGNANMEVKIARGTHPNLRSRLEEVDNKQQQTNAQLAQTERNLEAKKLDKNRGAVTSADLSQEVKEQITGGSVAVVGQNTILKENLVDGQVSPSKTTFYEPLSYTDLPVTTTSNRIVYQGIGNMAFIDVLPNTTYEVEVFGENVNRFRVYGFQDDFYKENFNQDDYFRIDYTLFSDDSVKRAKIKTPTNCKVLAVYLNAGVPRTIDYELEVVADLSEVVSDVNKMKSGIPVEYDVITAWTDSAGKQFEMDERGTSVFFDVVPNKHYDIDLQDSKNTNRFRIYGFKNRNYKTDLIDTDDIITIDYTLFVEDNVRNVTVKIPNDCYAIGIYLNNGSLYNPMVSLKIEENLSLTVDELTKTVSDLNTELDEIYGRKRGAKFFTSGNPSLYITTNDVDPSGMNVGDIMDIYAEVEDSPFLTKNILGQDGLGNNLYEYTIDRPLPQIVDHVTYTPYVPEYETRPKMKMLLVAGTHGDEIGSAVGMAVFIRDLLTNMEDSALQFIRNNLTIKLIPILNPSGINNNTRGNHNGVDLNRDYTKKSQNESKIVTSWIDNNLDAVAFMDYHNSSRYVSLWPHPDMQMYHELFFSVLATLQDRWKADDPLIREPIGEMVTNTTTTNSQMYAHHRGMLGLIVEGARSAARMKGQTTPPSGFDAEAIKHGNDLLVNTIVAIMKYYS